jgi:hypothetical protein
MVMSVGLLSRISMTAEFDGTDVEIICEQVVEEALDLWEADCNPEAVLWDAVGTVVPQLTRPVSEAVLEYSSFAPLDPVVEKATTDRNSDEEEIRRAEAVTVLLQEATERLDGREEISALPTWTDA